MRPPQIHNVRALLSSVPHALARALILSLVALAAFGQSALTGGLHGTIGDALGGPIANATVSLTSASLAFNASQQTDATGSYRFLRLAPATDYTCKVPTSRKGPLVFVASISEPAGKTATFDTYNYYSSLYLVLVGATHPASGRTPCPVDRPVSRPPDGAKARTQPMRHRAKPQQGRREAHEVPVRCRQAHTRPSLRFRSRGSPRLA